MPKTYRPQMTQAGLSPTHSVTAYDEFGQPRERQVAGEMPLTIYLDRKEIVTIMTLGGQPEALTLGYLKNQGLVARLEEIKSIQVDWETHAVAIVTDQNNQDIDQKLAKRTVTTGCGQGTIFGDMMGSLDDLKLANFSIKQSNIYSLLKNLNQHNEVYKSAGAVHGCALCTENEILYFVEDVGRHNAVDAIAGLMWLDGIVGEDKYFYTTGRLTSEMVIKVAQMGVSVLISRSGLTEMGLELAIKIGVRMIARAKGRHFLVFNGYESIEYDAIPQPKQTLNKSG